MKAFKLALVIAMTSLTASAFASGGIFCNLNQADTLSTIEMSVPVSNTIGSGLFGKLEISGSGAVYRRYSATVDTKQVAQYMNNANQLYILAVDDQAEKIIFALNYNWKTKKGVAEVNTSGRKLTLKNIFCEFAY